MQNKQKDESSASAKRTVSKPKTNESVETGLTKIFKDHQCDEFFSCEWNMFCEQGKHCCCEKHSSR